MASTHSRQVSELSECATLVIQQQVLGRVVGSNRRTRDDPKVLILV